MAGISPACTVRCAFFGGQGDGVFQFLGRHRPDRGLVVEGFPQCRVRNALLHEAGSAPRSRQGRAWSAVPLVIAQSASMNSWRSSSIVAPGEDLLELIDDEDQPTLFRLLPVDAFWRGPKRNDPDAVLFFGGTSAPAERSGLPRPGPS